MITLGYMDPGVVLMGWFVLALVISLSMMVWGGYGYWKEQGKGY